MSSPVNGSVRVGGVAVTSFTGTQLSAGQVSFVHNGSETLTASFQVAVEDGNEDGSTPMAQTFNLDGDRGQRRAGSDRRSRGDGERGRQLRHYRASILATAILTTCGRRHLHGVEPGQRLGPGQRRRGDFLHRHAARRRPGELRAQRLGDITASFQVAVEDGNEDGSTPMAQTFNLT